MSASRIPTFSPTAAKPKARLQEVVDLPTPPFPEATAMTCLTPGMPTPFDVAGAFRSASSLRSTRIPFLRLPRAQIILSGHGRRALRRRVRVEAFVPHGLDAAVRAHLDAIETLRIGALEHPMLLAEFCQ